MKLYAYVQSQTVKFRHLGNGKALKTDKGFCLGTAKPSNKAGTKLILDECLAGVCLMNDDDTVLCVCAARSGAILYMYIFFFPNTGGSMMHWGPCSRSRN